MVTKSFQQRAEDITSLVSWIAGVFFALVSFLPVLVIILIGIFSGVYPTQAEGGALATVPGYPAFNPQTWLFYIPAIATLFLAVWTIPLPLRAFPGVSRFSLILSSGLFAIIAFLFGGAFHGAPGIMNEGLWTGFIFLAAWLLFVLRALLGALHLLPRKWREARPTVRRQRRKPGVDVTNSAHA